MMNYAHSFQIMDASSILSSRPGQIHILGEPGKFYTVASVETVESSPRETLETNQTSQLTSEEPADDDDDILVCGQCKLQFSDLDEFIKHKRKCKRKKANKCNNNSAKQETIPKNPINNNSQNQEIVHKVLGEAGDGSQTYILVNSDDLIVDDSQQESNIYAEALPTQSIENEVLPAQKKSNLIVQSYPTKNENENLNEGPTVDNTAIEQFKVGNNDTCRKLEISTNDNAQKKGSSIDYLESNKKLYCSYCHKGFNKNFDLSQHVRSHTGEKPYQCVVCGRGFAQKSNVKKHMATHKVWPKGHKTLPADLPNHIVVGSSDGTKGNNSDNGACDKLDDNLTEDLDPFSKRTIETKEMYKGDKCHIVLKNCYQCNYCNKTFRKYPHFKTHMNQHQNEKCYRCTVSNCGKLLRDLEGFLNHMNSHESEREYRCHICSKKYSDLNQLSVHQFTHSADSERHQKQQFQCDKCKNKYASIEALEHHIETTSHSYLCSLCNKEFSAERHLRKHLSVTHLQTGASYSCTFCEKLFKNENALKLHTLIHTGELPFSCNQCGAKFNRKDKLKRHMLSHSPTKKFKCPFNDIMNCTKEFHRFDKLKVHIMTHGNVKPFKCQICNGGFSRREHLNTHINHIHSPDRKKFHCPKCNTQFSSQKSLKAHKNCPQIHKNCPQIRSEQPPAISQPSLDVKTAQTQKQLRKNPLKSIKDLDKTDSATEIYTDTSNVEPKAIPKKRKLLQSLETPSSLQDDTNKELTPYLSNESEYQLPVQIDPNKELETSKNLALQLDHTFLTFTSDNSDNPNSSQTTIHFTSSSKLNSAPIHTANLVTSSESTIVHLNLEDSMANSVNQLEDNNQLLNLHQQSDKASLVQSSIGSATSEAMEILYADAGHGILLTSPEEDGVQGQNMILLPIAEDFDITNL